MKEQNSKKRKLTGRPKLAEKDLKKHRIVMRFTEDDFNIIKRRAENGGLKPSEYSEDLILKSRSFFAANPRETIEGFKSVAKEINPIGNNLNQLARHANVSYKAGVVDKDTFIKMNELIGQFIEKQNKLLELNMKLLKSRK